MLLCVDYPSKSDLAAVQKLSKEKSQDHAKLAALHMKHDKEKQALFDDHQQRFHQFQRDRYLMHDPEYAEHAVPIGRHPDGVYVDPSIQITRTGLKSREDKLSINEYNMQYGNEASILRNDMMREYEDLVLLKQQELLPTLKNLQRKEKEKKPVEVVEQVVQQPARPAIKSAMKKVKFDG